MLVLKYLSEGYQLAAPSVPFEYEAIYSLRWRILRKDWGLAPGTEQDDLEMQSIHRMVIDKSEQSFKVLACGRLQPGNDESWGQIRYMAVDPNHQRIGLGLIVLNSLEEAAAEMNLDSICLNARETAVGFYRKAGYQSLGETTPYLGIRHFRMVKLLTQHSF